MADDQEDFPFPLLRQFGEEAIHEVSAAFQHYQEQVIKLKKELDAACEVLVKAAERFREYERLHAAKPDPMKAARNAEMAEMCEQMLTKLEERYSDENY